MVKKSDYEYQKTQSRKWKLVLLVILLATLGTVVPPVISAWVFGALKPLVIISGTEYVSVLTLVVSAYFGANVFQKHVENKASASLELKANMNVSDGNNEEGEA